MIGVCTQAYSAFSMVSFPVYFKNSMNIPKYAIPVIMMGYLAQKLDYES